MIYDPPKSKQGYVITLFTDSSDSWIMPWLRRIHEITRPYHDVRICQKKEEIPNGDFTFLLGCTRIIKKEYLERNKHNLVIHESALPKGKGWSPLSWQILEGMNTIPVTLFEADESLDAGSIYLRDFIQLNGDELLPEIKEKQGIKTVELVLRFLSLWPDLEPIPQIGESSFYAKRHHLSDKLDITKTIAEQFNHLRIVDNEQFPAWFEIKRKKYKLKIYPYK